MSFASSSAASGGKFRLRARMRTLGRGATSNGFGPQNGDTQHQGEPCFSLALVDEDDEGAQQQARRAGRNGTHDEIILHREHLTDTENETKTHQRKGRLSRKRTRRTADLQPSDASLRFKTLDALYKFIELSCPGTPSLQDAAKVDLFVDVDALGLDTQRAFAFLELTDHRHKVAEHLLRITSANWLPVVSDKNFCAVLQRWLLNASNRRAAKLRAAFTQIDRFLLGKGKLRYAVLRLNAGETHFQADPSQQLQDVRDHHAQGLHELWELALHAENHASFSDERLEQILTFLERAERNHPTQAIAAGALQALALTTTGTYQRLKQLEAPQRVFHVIHNNIANLVSYPPPQAALLLLRMLAHFASDPMCIAPALDQLGFFAACIQSGASPEICEAILGVYLPILNVSAALSATVADEAKPAHNAGTGAGNHPTISAPCELQSYSCTELTRELSTSRRRRTKRNRASSVKSVTIGNARASTTALGDFLREIAQRAATPACTDVACKVGAAVLVAQIAHGAELQDKLCRAKKCTGRVHIQTKHDPNTLPLLHPLRNFLLASKVVSTGVVGLGRWALAKIARRVEARVSHFAPSLRRLRDLVLGTEAHSLDASSAGDGTFHRMGSQASIASASIAVAGVGDEPRSFSSKPEISVPAKGYLGEAYGETNELSASKGTQWMSYETKDHLPNSTDAYVLEVLFHVINSCSAWSIAMNKQCVGSRDVFVRCKTHASSVQDRELDAVFNFLAHFLGFGHEGWLRLYLVETFQHCPRTQHRLDEALCLAAIATERLLDVPQIAARLLRRGTSAAVSDVAQSHETHEDASGLLNSFRRRATSNFKTARRRCRDDADTEVHARSQLLSNGEYGKLSVQDDIALHRVNVPQPQASPFPYWPALPVLTPIAVQNATSAAVEESMARSLINMLAKTQQGHDLVDSNGGLHMLLSHLTSCRSSWQFARSKTTHVLLAGAIMLFTFGPVLPDANADTVDLNRPLEALPKNTLQQPSAPASPALAAVAARKSDLVAAATATSALSAAGTGSGSGTGTSDVSAFLEAASKSRAPSSPRKPSMSKKPLSPDASQRPAATSAVASEAKLNTASDALTSNNHLKTVSSDVISALIYQLAAFAANDELHFANCVSSLAMATWCLARHQENATLFISQQNAVGTLLGIIHRAIGGITKAGPEIAKGSLARLENIEASLSALWLLVFQGDTLRQASARTSLFEDLLLHRAVQTACDIVDTVVAARERCGRVARQSVQLAGPAKDIMQRIALQALNLLWLVVDFSPVLLIIPAKPANAFMLDILYKCSYSRAMCPQVRERSTNLLAHLAHRIRTLKDPRVIAQKGVLKQKLRASNLLKLAIHHLDEDTEVLRTTGATLLARLPLSEEHQQLLKNSGRATQLLELATESSHKERRAALLALLKYAESDVGQKEIAKLGFYRLLVGCWVAADSQTPDLQDLLSALLQLLAENTANRPKIYQAELRAKEISGWAALSDAEWQATLAQASEEDDRSDVGSSHIANAVTNSRRDIRCAFTRWLAELESSLREDASNNLLPRASRSFSDRECQTTLRQSGRRPCPKEEDDLCKAMSAFRAHRLVLETSPQKITSPDRSLLWPFRSIILAPNASPLNAAPSKSQEAKSALRANDHLARDMTSSLISYERDNANPESFDEEQDLEMQFRLAKERAWARTNKTDTHGSPTARSPGANNVTRVKASAARSPKPTPPQSPKRPFAAAGSPLLLPPWKSASIGPNEKSGNRVWLHETVAGPTNRHSRFTTFSRAQFAAANEKLHHRLRSPVKSLWQEADQAAKLSVDPWAPSIKDIGVTSVTVERETFCFAPAGSEVAAAQETPAQFVARALQHPRNSQRLKRDKMALFGHVEGARVHKELTIYEAPEGRRGYVFYNGPRNIIDLYLDFDKLGAPPSPHDLVHLGRIDVDASLQHDENKDNVKRAVDVHLSARQILDALPGLPDGASGMLVDTRSLVSKLEPKVFQKIQRPEPPQVYSQNHEDGARIPPPVLGEPLKQLAHLERGQAETGVCWTPDGCVLDDTLPFAIRVPGRIVRLLEGAQEEDEGPQLCVEAFDGRRAFLDENPIAKACASVDWELNMKKKGFRDFLDHFDPEDAEIARDLLIGASPLLLSIYRFYCALTPQNPFAMLPPSFLRLLTDIHVLGKKGSTFTHDCMNIFIRVASMVPDDNDAKVRRLNEQCDPLSLKRCRRLMRHEFLDVILRIAHAKYCNSENPSIAAALDHFIQVHVVRYLGPETVLDFDSWRVRYLYTEDVSAVIQAHRSMLIQWFTEMAGTTRRSSRWGGLEKERLAIQEWNQGLRNLGLFTANFTIRESTFAFVLSTTNVVNWVAEWEPMIALSYQDFLEALGRVAELISIPTPEQLEFFGVETIVEFYSLMERTNLWSALDHSSTQAQTRLKIWQKSSDEDGADDSTAEEGTKTDERSLSEKLTLLLELLESRNSIDARREAELSFWISKKKRRSSQDRTVLANNDLHHENTHEEHAGPTQDSGSEVDDAKTSSTKSSTGRRRRSSATELFTLDEEEMAELDEEDVTAVSDDLETFEISTATKLHEMWRSKRARLSDGRFEPRIKVINNTEYDIANLEFHQLPDYFKLENLLASHAACESIRRCWNQTMGDTRTERLRNLRKTLKTPNFIEKASAEQHDNWLKRNGKLPWVTDEQRGRYEDLSEEEKQKDRDIVLVGIEVYLETQFSDDKAV